MADLALSSQEKIAQTLIPVILSTYCGKYAVPLFLGHPLYVSHLNLSNFKIIINFYWLTTELLIQFDLLKELSTDLEIYIQSGINKLAILNVLTSLPCIYRIMFLFHFLCGYIVELFCDTFRTLNVYTTCLSYRNWHNNQFKDSTSVDDKTSVKINVFVCVCVCVCVGGGGET